MTGERVPVPVDWVLLAGLAVFVTILLPSPHPVTSKSRLSKKRIRNVLRCIKRSFFSSDLQGKVLSRWSWCGDNSEMLQHAQRINIELFVYDDDVSLL